MSAARPAGWSQHATTVAWFEAWLRAVRTGPASAVDLARLELAKLGVEVRPIAQGGKP